MRIPRAQLQRVAALEARRPARDDHAHRELLEFMTDAELREYGAILLEHAQPCPSCGLDRKVTPDRNCHHPKPAIADAALRPEARQRVRELLRSAEARRLDAPRQGA